MTDEQRQADLLERYLNALANDPDALPPEELDPETAAFARMMAQEKPDVPESNWAATLADARVPNNGTGSLPFELSSEHEPEWEKQSMSTHAIPNLNPETQEQRSQALPYTLVAAVIALAAVGAILFAMNMGNNNPDNAFGFIQGATETSTPFATVMPSIVPSSTAFIQPPDDDSVTGMPPTVLPPATMIPSSGVGGGGGSVPTSGIAPSMQTMDDVLAQYPPTPLTLDQVYAGEISSDNPYITFSYVAPADMTLVALIHGTGFAPAVSYSIRSAPIENPFGSGGGGGGGGGPVKNPQLTKLNAGDTMQVVVRSQSVLMLGESGSYTVVFETLQTTTVDPNGGISGTFDAETAYLAYDFAVAAGETLWITVNTDEAVLDTTLQLHSENESQWFTDDDGGVRFNPEIFRAASAVNDTVTVIVAPAVAGQTGDFTVEVERIPVAEVESGFEFITLRLTEKQPTMVIRLTGEVGSSHTLNLRPLQADNALSLEITDGGNVLTSASGSNVSELRREFTFPASGEVYVAVEQDIYQQPGSDFSMEVELSLSE